VRVSADVDAVNFFEEFFDLFFGVEVGDGHDDNSGLLEELDVRLGDVGNFVLVVDLMVVVLLVLQVSSKRLSQHTVNRSTVVGDVKGVQLVEGGRVFLGVDDVVEV